MFQRERFAGEQRNFNGIDYRAVSFIPGNKPGQMQQAIEQWLAQNTAIQEDISRRFHGFKPRDENIQDVLGSYERSRIILSCGYDQYISWEGGFFIETETENGTQALSFLEYCLNVEKPRLPVNELRFNRSGQLLETVIRPNLPLSKQSVKDIPFDISEAVSRNGARCLQLVTGAEHPELMRREMWHGYVEELIDKPLKFRDLSHFAQARNFLGRFRRHP